MIKLHQITFSDGGRKINYDYEVSHNVLKYFNKKNLFYSKYSVDVTTTPKSIAVIPFLSNIMPIAWFVGFDVYVNEVDETFYHSLLNLKEVFIKYHPEKELRGNLIAKKLIPNSIDGDEVCLLFSGGLDSFESYTRNYKLNPYLISIHGADVEISDTKRWTDFKNYNQEEKIVNKERLSYIETNVRDFYTYRVDLLVDLGWWGKIQHGMSLIGAIAPLSCQFKIKKIFIGSSRTEEVNVGWGSSPIIDEKMKWGNSHIIHDGYHLRRTDKIDNIVSYAANNNTTINLRVCYSEYRDGYNCNVCAKCLRTIFGIILSGSNPNNFGFETPPHLYDLIFKSLTSNTIINEGGKYHWKCLQDKASTGTDFFVLEDEVIEQQKIDHFISLKIDEILNTNKNGIKSQSKRNFLLRNKYAFLYKIYRKLRYQKI